jgi:uncharacterized protein YjbI with pentapeptide repeats
MTFMTIVSGDELIRNILAGETDFDSIRLVNPDLTRSPFYVDAMIYTRNRDTNHVYEFSHADLTGLVAPGLNLRHVHFDEATLENISLPYCDLAYAQFTGARISGDLSHSDLSCANLERALVHDLDVTRSLFFEIALWNTALFNLTGVRDARHIPTAALNETIVDSRTYLCLQDMYPKKSILFARDVEPGSMLPNGTPIPVGSYRVNSLGKTS